MVDTAEAQPGRIARRHDLDAVRSFAMLLGIALHAALAYTGPGWVVSDGPSSGLLGFLVASVHGFRMPLFFLLSGFFSAMLWSKRGASGLITQRTKRILIPLVLGGSIIIPLQMSAIGWAVRQKTQQIQSESTEDTQAPGEPSPDLWTAAANGDMHSLERFVASAETLDTPDPSFGLTPLGWTAVRDQPEAAKYLLDHGADPSAPYRDGNTPLHTSCFFGRADVAERLLEAGADLSIKSPTGEIPLQSMRHNQQITEYIANMISVPIEFEQVAEGREQIREFIAQRESEPKSKAPDHLNTTPDGESLLRSLQHGSFFQHLWFLWFLCLLNAGFIVVGLLGSKLPGSFQKFVMRTPMCLLWILPLSVAMQLQMHNGGSMPGFGPDTSAGVVPMVHVLMYYAAFFGFGAAWFTARGSEARVGRAWMVMLPLALILLPFGLLLGFHGARAAELIPNDSARHWISTIVQIGYAWLMTLGLLGCCESLLSKSRAWIRYISDSSYWLYLIHLPLVIVGQALLLRVDAPPVIKFGVLTVITTVVLLISYQFCIRYTPIGTLLNGRRTRNGSTKAGQSANPSSSSSP